MEKRPMIRSLNKFGQSTKLISLTLLSSLLFGSCANFNADPAASYLLLNQLGVFGQGLSNDIAITESDGDTVVYEGGTTDSYTIAIGVAPKEIVRVDFTSTGAVTISPTYVEFQPGVSDAGFKVTVTANSDQTFTGDAIINHTITTQDSVYSSVTVPDLAVTVHNDEKVLFIASSTGQIAGMGSVSGADSLCNANLPAGVTNSAAVLVDGSSRIACTTDNCSGGISENVGWPMSPNTEYVRGIDGAYIGTTNAAAVFGFPLQLAPGDASYAGKKVVTGMTTDWRSSGLDCNGWQAPGQNASVGDADVTNSSLINNGVSVQCSTTNFNILCTSL